MAQYGYAAYKAKQQSRTQSSSQTSNNFKVGYFNDLKNDKDSVIVRIVSTMEDLEFATVHRIKVGDRFRGVNCLREGNESFDKCPLCAQRNGEGNFAFPIANKVYIKLVVYTTEVIDGVSKIVGHAKVWERPVSFVSTLENIADNYGGLNTTLFRIIRNGEKGSMTTSYDLIPLPNNDIYNETNYPKTAEHDFDKIKSVGKMYYLTKSKEDIEEYLKTGSFPESTQTTQTSNISQENNKVGELHQPQQNIATVAEETQTVQPRNESSRYTPNSGVRPRRVY